MFKWVSVVCLAMALVSCGTKKKSVSSRQTPDFEWSEESSANTPVKKDRKKSKELDKSSDRSASLHYERKEIEAFLEDWWGVPHRMGGTSKKGVDCSGLMCVIYQDLYNNPLQSRRAQDIYAEVDPVLDPDDLQVGDMVFFKVGGVRIDHVGFYLGDGDFAHASSSRGVMVSNLSENYWQQRYFRGGRRRP